jgi:hypothetical protein
MTDHEAACACGQIRVTCRGQPMRVSMCHCLACQRRTGSVFAVQAWYPREQIQPVLGSPKQYVRQADSGRRVTFNFCPECGSTVFWSPEQRPELIAVAVGAFADPDFEKPGLSVWERQRHPWTLTIAELSADHLD